MAILKDLIVHGSSRFLNKIYAEELETSAFEAESAVIKKLTAKDATVENATVIGLLDVQGQLHTNTWTNSNIATIDGCFYIAPTLSSDSGKISFSSTSVASLTGSYSAVTSLYIGDSSSGNTVQWTSGSNVLLTGEVEVNGQWLPLGTLLGTLSANATTSSIGLTGLTDNRHNTSSIITDIRNAVSNASLNYRNLKISLYQRKDGTNSKPLGIYMTAMGTNGKTFIDIYGGVNATTTAGSSGGFADPNLRIGNLSGLGAVEGNTPQGWGIYTTNGYFKGVVVSSAGKIGGWSIGTSGIFNGITGVTTTGSTAGTFIGTGGISNYKNTSTYVNIQNGVITAKGVNLTGQINATAGNIGGATITGGVLTVPAANVSGELTAATINGSKITAGDISAERIKTNLITAIDAKVTDLSALSATIGGFQIDSTSIHTKNVATTSNADNSIALSSADFTRTINSTSRSGLRFAIGDKFGVTGDGTIYASSATISGAITATSLTLGSGVTIGISQVANLQTTLTNAATTATKYISKIDNTGITIQPYNDSSSTADASNYIKLDSDGLEIFQDGNSVAQYGDTARIGKESGSNIEIADDSMIMSVDNNPLIQMRLNDSTMNITKRANSTMQDMSNATSYTFVFDTTKYSDFSEAVTVKIDLFLAYYPNVQQSIIYSFTYGTSATKTITNRRWSADEYEETFSCTLSYNGTDTIVISNWSNSSSYKTIIFRGYYILEKRTASFILGSTDQSVFNSYSVSEGYNCYATGECSHAEGWLTEASNGETHAEGYSTEASGQCSHAEGHHTKATKYASHAEGQYTEATGASSHAEGGYTEASGQFSHAGGYYTKASSNYQTAIGKFNEEDTNDTYAFIIGNGTIGTYSNALMVSWDGNVVASGGIYIPSTEYLSLANDSDYTTVPSSDNRRNLIYGSLYNGQMNNYYCAQGYHAFYAGGTEQLYIYNDNVLVKGSFNAVGTITQNGTAVSLAGHNHSADNITSGTLAIARGGSGQSAVTTTTTVSQIVSVGSGFSVTSAEYAQWGKLAMIHIVFKKNSTAISSNSNITLGTLVSGKRPKFNAMGCWGLENVAQVYSSGAIHIYGTVSANESVGIYSTYLLP